MIQTFLPRKHFGGSYVETCGGSRGYTASSCSLSSKTLSFHWESGEIRRQLRETKRESKYFSLFSPWGQVWKILHFSNNFVTYFFPFHTCVKFNWIYTVISGYPLLINCRTLYAYQDPWIFNSVTSNDIVFVFCLCISFPNHL